MPAKDIADHAGPAWFEAWKERGRPASTLLLLLREKRSRYSITTVGKKKKASEERSYSP